MGMDRKISYGEQMILSIESSCDDSAVAITEIATKKLIYHNKVSQEREHSKYGGVVPELASRLHTIGLPEVLEGAVSHIDKIKAVAVTNQPGLAVTLNEGLMMAKTIATLQKVPLIPVHHLKGHIYSLFIEKTTLMPILVLLISGGHTMIVRVENFEKMEILATSMDDSVGESFDKVAKMMGLGYPGGPLIEVLAKEGDEDRFDLPVPLRNSPLIAFSLSGLKNAVRLEVQKLGGTENMTNQDKSDLSASFQKAVKLHLLQKSKKIFAKENIQDFAIVGGASANQYLRKAYQNLCQEFGKTMHTARLEYCSDNAAMIGRYSIDAYEHNKSCDPHSISVERTRKQKNGTLL